MKTQTKLEIPPRPTKHTIDLTPAFIECAKGLKKWCNLDGDEQQIADDIAEAYKYTSSAEGYELAKRLENQAFYEPDLEMVEQLDSLWHKISNVEREAVKKWVTEHQFKPQYSVGDSIEIPEGTFYTQPAHSVTGTITEVNQNGAKYTVNIPEIGHVPAGELGTQGIVLAWEKLHPLTPQQ